MRDLTSRTSMRDTITANELTRAGCKGEIVIAALQLECGLKIGNDHHPFEESGNQPVGRSGGTYDIGGPAESPVR